MSMRVFVVVGAKGGVGATTIAIKMVRHLPGVGERMIVDADLFGKRSLADWYDVCEDLDVAHTIGSATVVKTKTGTLVMELARKYEDGLLHLGPSIRRELARLTEHALVVVDAPQPFAANVRPFIAIANKIIVVFEPTLMGVAAACSMLSALERGGVAASRIVLVQSNVHGGRHARQSDIIGGLPFPVSAVLHHEKDSKHDTHFERFITMLALAASQPESREHTASVRSGEPIA